MLRDREAQLALNTIKDASEQGLILVIEGRETSVPWSTVTGVSAGRAKLHRKSETWILLLCLRDEMGQPRPPTSGWRGRAGLAGIDDCPSYRLAGDCALRGLGARAYHRDRADRDVSAGWAVIVMQAIVLSPAPRLPALVASAGVRAPLSFLEFFAVTIRNLHTRRAYGRAIGEFLSWCSQHDIRRLLRCSRSTSRLPVMPLQRAWRQRGRDWICEYG